MQLLFFFHWITKFVLRKIQTFRINAFSKRKDLFYIIFCNSMFWILILISVVSQGGKYFRWNRLMTIIEQKETGCSKEAVMLLCFSFILPWRERKCWIYLWPSKLGFMQVSFVPVWLFYTSGKTDFFYAHIAFYVCKCV